MKAASKKTTSKSTRSASSRSTTRLAKSQVSEKLIIDGSAIAPEQEIWRQFQRIGGDITPADVSGILQTANMGEPARFVDLWNETRQKDCEIQSCCGIREDAVALTTVTMEPPPDPTAKEKKLAKLCERIVDEFENWPQFITNLTTSYIFGHATSQAFWTVTNDGWVIPYREESLNKRDFIFTREGGRLAYRPDEWGVGTEGIDLLASFPGRIVQLQRHVGQDVMVREGLARLLVWAGLFRNWDLKDWVDLGQIGWKPWRIGLYDKGSSNEDIQALRTFLQNVGKTGTGFLPKSIDFRIEWPKGQNAGGAGSPVHKDMFEVLAREIRRAIIGTTTSTDIGTNGDRGATETRDRVRRDIAQRDAKEIGACIRKQLFKPVATLNFGPDVRPPLIKFGIEDPLNIMEFTTGVYNASRAGVAIPQKWVRAQMGAPDPEDGEPVTGAPPTAGKPSGGAESPKTPGSGKPKSIRTFYMVEDDE
jgi:phage gp29-like protein